jgi:hypothetical protein
VGRDEQTHESESERVGALPGGISLDDDVDDAPH